MQGVKQKSPQQKGLVETAGVSGNSGKSEAVEKAAVSGDSGKSKWWRRRISRRRRQGSLRKWWILSAVMLFALAGVTGCSSSKSDNAKMAEAPQSQAATSYSGSASEAKQDAKAPTQDSIDVKNANEASKPQETKGSTTPMSVTPAIGTEGTEGFNRKLIYKANLVMPVEDYGKAQTELRNLVALSGAYILQFSESANTGERGGTFTIKVAASGFVSLLDGLEKISPSLQRNVQGQDVTEEYVDLQSRLKAKQAVETRLLGFMEKAVKTDELLSFSNELSKVQEEIERIKGRMRYLDQNVSYSTVELRMYQQTGTKTLLSTGKPSLGARLQDALDSSLHVLSIVLQGILVFLAAALPIILLVLILLIPVLYYRKKRNQRLAELRKQLNQQNSTGSANENN